MEESKKKQSQEPNKDSSGWLERLRRGNGKPSPEVSKAASSISKSDVKDFAKTKHKGLPNKKDVKEQTKVSPEDRKMINKEIMMQKKQHILDKMRMQMKKRGELPITAR